MKVWFFNQFLTYFFKVLPINARSLHVRANIIIYLSCWGVDCASPHKSKLEWKLHFLEWKSRSLELKNYNIPTSISAFYHHFLLSLSRLSCKLQLVDLITVSGGCLAVRQTVLLCFFFRKRRKRKETKGWKIKNVTGRFLVQIHPSRFVSKVICPVPKIAIEAGMFFLKFVSHRMATPTL